MSLATLGLLMRLAHRCRYEPAMPKPRGDRLLDLGPECAIRAVTAAEPARAFASVRLAWNEAGLGVQLSVTGKDRGPVGAVGRPRASDGVTLWIDTRDARASHRASRYCTQFHLLAAGGGDDAQDPVVLTSKIARALDDAPPVDVDACRIRRSAQRGGYVLEAFLPAAALSGYDPDQHSRLGFFYAIHDVELGDQLLSLDSDFPFWEDPSLWSVLVLDRAAV